MGIGITVATFFSFQIFTIYFGILHLIGLSVVLSAFFLKPGTGKLFLGSIVLIAGFFMQSTTFDSPLLLWFGLAPHGFQTFDYWPLMPWFGLFLIGMYFGEILYENKKPSEFSKPIINQINFLGRKSLLIYLIHQPILLVLLYILGFRVLI